MECPECQNTMEQMCLYGNDEEMNIDYHCEKCGCFATLKWSLIKKEPSARLLTENCRFDAENVYEATEGDGTMFKFSEQGVKNPEIYSKVYADFIEWCKTKAKSGTFSTYMDGEPVCFTGGVELSYRLYQANCK